MDKHIMKAAGCTDSQHRFCECGEVMKKAAKHCRACALRLHTIGRRSKAPPSGRQE